MSKTKKIFISISAALMVVIIAFLITLNAVKINVYIETGKPYQINVFNCSTVALQSVLGEEKKDEEKYNEILNNLNQITETSALQRMINRVGVDHKIEIDSQNKYLKWSADIQNKNIVVELIYDKMQDLVVYQNNKTRVISYYCLAFVIPATDDFSEIIVYWADTSNENSGEKSRSYANNAPLTLYGTADEIIDMVKEISKTQKN